MCIKRREKSGSEAYLRWHFEKKTLSWGGEVRLEATEHLSRLEKKFVEISQELRFVRSPPLLLFSLFKKIFHAFFHPATGHLFRPEWWSIVDTIIASVISLFSPLSFG